MYKATVAILTYLTYFEPCDNIYTMSIKLDIPNHLCTTCFEYLLANSLLEIKYPTPKIYIVTFKGKEFLLTVPIDFMVDIIIDIANTYYSNVYHLIDVITKWTENSNNYLSIFSYLLTHERGIVREIASSIWKE